MARGGLDQRKDFKFDPAKPCDEDLLKIILEERYER